MRLRLWFTCCAAFSTLACDRPAPEQSAPPPPPLQAQQPAERAAPPPPLELSDPPPSFAPLVDSVKGAVVNVEVTARFPVELSTEGGMEPFLMPSPELRQGAGSGFLVAPEGRVLTNSHVVDGATSIRVKLDDGRSYEAEVLGQDPLTDLALLQLKKVEGALPVVALGDSDALRVGDWVVAIGNPFGLASSVSAGILSAKARDIRAGPYDDFLQTDAAISPGNSGGPLFDLSGRVVGINTAIVGGAGIGFAVPSKLAQVLLPQLERGQVRRGWLGMTLQDLTPELARALGVERRTGAVVTDVADGSPAERAGLQADDVVVELDDSPLKHGQELTRGIALHHPGDVVVLEILRKGAERKIKVKLGERPDLEGVAARKKLQERQNAGAENGRLGLAVEDPPPELGRGASGALVAAVTPGSPADRAGLAPGMRVLEAGGRAIRSSKDLVDALRSKPTGSVVLLRVEADGHRGLRAITVP